MTYEELNLFNKYTYNRVDYKAFKEALNNTVPNVADSYVEEKWVIFKRSPIQFTASYDKSFCCYLYTKMEKENYRG